MALVDLLVAADESEPLHFTAVNLASVPGSWMLAEVVPSETIGYWHAAAILHACGDVIYTKRPAWREAIIPTLEALSVPFDVAWSAKPADRQALNPWSDAGRETPPKRDTRSVYFLQAEHGGPIKIGVAHDPRARMADIQRMCPEKLILLATYPGVGAAGEALLHRGCAHWRLHGEWFEPHEALNKLIANLQSEATP